MAADWNGKPLDPNAAPEEAQTPTLAEEMLRQQAEADANRRLDADLLAFLKSPEARDEDRAFRFLDDYTKNRWGIDCQRGNAWTPDRQPYANARQYADAMAGVLVRGYSAIATPEYKKWMAAKATGDRAQMIAAAGIETTKMAHRDDGAYAFFDPGMGAPNATAPKTDAEIDDELKEYAARVEGQNFVDLVRTVGHDLEPQERDIVNAALKNGDGLPAEKEADFAVLCHQNPEKAARVLYLVNRSRRNEYAFWRDVGHGFAETWNKTYGGLRTALENTLAEQFTASEFAAQMAGVDSAKYYWNEDEKKRYAELLALWKEDPSDLKVIDPKTAVDNLCAARLAKEALPAAERNRQRREQLMVEQAMGHQPYDAYGFGERAVIGAVSTLPYMTLTAIPYAGFVLNAVSYFEQTRDDIIMAGGDPDEARGAQMLLAAAWSGIEQLEFRGLMGKPFTGLQRKAMLAHVWKAAGRDKLRAIGQLALATEKEALAKTLYESVQEGFQGAIEGTEKSWFKNHDLRKALADGGEQAVGDFVESIGSMGILGHLGAIRATVTANKAAADAESLADYAGRKQQVINILRGTTIDPEADPTAAKPEIKAMLNDITDIWNAAPSGIAAIDQIKEKYGFTDEQTRKVAEYLDLRQALLRAAAEMDDKAQGERIAAFAGNAFRVGQDTTYDPVDLLHLVNPNITVEDVEVPTVPRPQAEREATERADALRSEIEQTKAAIAQAKNRSERRPLELYLRKLEKKLRKAEAKVPEEDNRPRMRVRKVTVPVGADSATRTFTLTENRTGVDIHSPGYAASVAEAMKDAAASGEATDGSTMSVEEFRALDAQHKLDVAVTDAQYLAMTPEERADYVREWNLGSGGDFRMVDDATGKEVFNTDAIVEIMRAVQVKDGQITAKPGTRFGGNWTLAHEYGHAISKFAREVGILPTDGKTVAVMRKLFGDPRPGVDELWNEEAANNGLAEYLRDKFDFKPLTPEERAAAKGFFKNAWATLKGIFTLTGHEAPVAPVEKSQREQALDAAYEALRTGDFSTLDAFAGIEFAEDKATPPSSEAAATEEAPAAPETPSTPSAPTASPIPAPAAPRAPAASTPAPAPSPTVSTAALDTAMANLASDPEAVVAAKPVRTGTKRTVFTPGYEMSIEADAMWAPLSDLVESTDDREVQMRDRSRMATNQQIHDKTRKGVFQPLALFPGTKSDDGAPIVGGGLRIISGHGRKRMLETLVREGRFAEYLDAVNAECRRQGMPTAPEGMVNPVLVLRVTGGLDKRSDLTRFAELSNRWGGLERSGAEHAESDARKITDALLRLYAPDASGNLLAASNRPFMAAFLKAVGATGLTNKDGTPTAEAALRVQRAMMAAIFGDDEKVRTMVQNLMERSGELSLATLQNALLRSAGKLLAMKRHHGSFDIVADVREAAYQYIAWRSAQKRQPKLTLADHLNEQDFFTETATPMQQALARLLEVDRFGTVLDKYGELVAKEAVDAQGLLGGIDERHTPLQLLGMAERAMLAEGETPVTPDPASDEAAQPEAQGRNDGAAREERGRYGVRPAAGRAGTPAGEPGRPDGAAGAGRRALAREVVVQDVAASIEAASPGSDPAAAASLARHSVRQVREERMAEYAASVSKNARRWLKDAARRLDERMKAAGFTEKVWHGTYGEDFNTFKFSANSHDVPAAYFAYSRGTAQNYAALTGMDQAWDEADDSLYNTRQFYVNPGKVLDLDESGNPTTFDEFKQLLAKAYADGYNAVRVKGALDDQGARLDEFDNGPVTFLEADEMPGDGEVNFETDILIVMQQPGDNAAARIKAADPVTFMDEDYGGMPVPLDMRADRSMPDVRFSVVRDPALLQRLESEPTVKAYRAMQMVDGKLYPPMAAKLDGEWQTPAELGEWIQAEERPDLVKDGKFVLNKGNGSNITAAYNPYWHTSRSPLNDQFSSAYKRPNLVTVEVEVPASELTSGYKAEGAKDAVGEMDWHSGPVSSKLAKLGNSRRVILSRWCKPVRVVPDAEVADTIAQMLDGTDITIPANVVTPSLRAELEQRNVPIADTTRHSVARPMTAVEIARAVEYFGTTEDPKEAAYILPDGRWLDYEQMGEHWEISQALNAAHRKQLDKLLEFDGDAAPYIDAALNAGLVRVTGGVFDLQGNPKELGLQMNVAPDAATARNLTDFVDAAAERYPTLRTFTVESHTEPGFVRQYDMADPRALAQIKRDIRESLVRHSVLSSGRYYGTGLRDIAHGLKRGDETAIAQAADLMALNVPPKAVLVPMPGHEGPATTMLPLAEAIAARVKGATVVDALVAEPHESNYTHKQRVHRPVKVTMHSTGAKIPKGRPVLVVDNVIASGATYRAAQAVIPNADLLTLADAGRGRETPGHREQMRHSVFMGVRGAVYDKPILNRLYDATDIAREHGRKATSKSRKWYTPAVRDEIYAKTGWWLGTDGQWRVEIPDMKPKTLAELPVGDYNGELAHPVPLTDLVSNTRLFKAYSELKNVTVWFIDADSDKMDGIAGMLTGNDIVMTWDDLTNLEPEDGEIKLTYQGMQTLTHEVQHYVQWLEGFATGGSQRVNGRRNYALLAGEVEARNAERRYGGPYGTLVSARQDEAERRLMIDHNMAPWQTEDVPTIEQLISHGDGMQTDVNGKPVARQSVTRGGGTRLSDLATAFVASRQLAGKEVSVEDTDRLLKNMGLTTLSAPDVVSRAQTLAERNKDRLRGMVERAAPELVQTLARANMGDALAEALDSALVGGAAASDPEIGQRVQQAIASRETRDLMTAKGFTAAQMMAELPVDLASAVLAVAEYEKTPEELARIEAARKKREEEAAAAGEDESLTPEERLAQADDPTYREPTDEERDKLQQLLDRARFAEEARKAEQDRLETLKKRKAEEAAAREQNAEEGEENPDEGGSGDVNDLPLLPEETVRRIAPVFESAELFAQFIVEWTSDHVVAKHPELPTTAEMWKSPVAVRELKQTATHILRKLAKDCLGSPSLNYSRNFADHAINELESDAEIKTFNAVRRKIANVYDQIHNAALHISRRDMVRRLINGTTEKDADGNVKRTPGIRQLCGAKGRFSAIQEEVTRAIDAKTELWGRHLIPLLTMSEEKLAAEIDRLNKIVSYDPTADDAGRAPTEDQVAEAADRLALAHKYGGMIRWMPGRIADAAAEILDQLNGKRQAFEQKRLAAENADKALRDALIAAVEAGAAAEYRKPGKRPVGRFFDSLMGNLTLEMQNMIRFCKDEGKRREALRAIEDLATTISEASAKYRVTLGAAQAELHEGLKACYGNAEAGIKHLLGDEIPEDAAKAIFTQDRNNVPTYGRLLQLYATTIQADYKENAEKHGRTAQLALMEATLTDQDRAFHAWAVEWFKRNRKALSDSVEEVTGLPVTSPDEMYTPARMLNEPSGLPVRATAWSPVPSALNRRVRHGLDFNEGVNFLSSLQEQCEVRAQTIGYAAAGIRLRNVLAHHDVQAAVRKHVGKAEMSAVLDHVTDVLVQNAERKDESAFLAPLNVARRWMARFALSGNIPSALKQLASMPVWANAILDGREVGLGRVLHYLTTVGTDEGRAAIRDLMESDGFKARYTMGWSEETQNVLMNPSKNRLLRYIEKAYDKGMVVNKAVDGVSCLWMAQGFYRDARAALEARGFSPDEAKSRALALTWSVCENGQQSGRIENMNALQRKGGAFAASVFQYKTAYLLQNNYIIQAARECRAGTPGAKGRLLRALFINTCYIPAFVALVNAAWSAIMGDEPPDEDPEKWPQWLKDFAWSMVGGVTAPLFILHEAGEGIYRKMTGQPTLKGRQGIPAVESALRVGADAATLVYDLGHGMLETFTPMDFEEEITGEKIQQDVIRLLKDIAAPARHVIRAVENRTKE